ncbi:hypothetical protein B0H19DRAFT_1069829 [Mycena capillaripes]|nr:hypothetical protein B0H19DRAFT_1069829 [Mycena capillaripes]
MSSGAAGEYGDIWDTRICALLDTSEPGGEETCSMVADRCRCLEIRRCLKVEYLRGEKMLCMIYIGDTSRCRHAGECLAAAQKGNPAAGDLEGLTMQTRKSKTNVQTLRTLSVTTLGHRVRARTGQGDSEELVMVVLVRTRQRIDGCNERREDSSNGSSARG